MEAKPSTNSLLAGVGSALGHGSQDRLKVRDPNGLEYYRVTSDIASFLPRIRFERRNEAAAQRASKSALGQSADPYGDY